MQKFKNVLIPEELRPVNKTPQAMALELVQSKQQIEATTASITTAWRTK